VVTCGRIKLDNLTFAVQDLRVFDEHGSYDLILCVESLQYVEKPGVVIEKLAKALRPNGYLFIRLFPPSNGSFCGPVLLNALSEAAFLVFSPA